MEPTANLGGQSGWGRTAKELGAGPAEASKGQGQLEHTAAFCMLSATPRVTSEVILVTPGERGSPAMPSKSRAICHITVVSSGAWEQPGEDRYLSSLPWGTLTAPSLQQGTCLNKNYDQ